MGLCRPHPAQDCGWAGGHRPARLDALPGALLITREGAEVRATLSTVWALGRGALKAPDSLVLLCIFGKQGLEKST